MDRGQNMPSGRLENPADGLQGTCEPDAHPSPQRTATLGGRDGRRRAWQAHLPQGLARTAARGKPSLFRAGGNTATTEKNTARMAAPAAESTKGGAEQGLNGVVATSWRCLRWPDPLLTAPEAATISPGSGGRAVPHDGTRLARALLGPSAFPGGRVGAPTAAEISPMHVERRYLSSTARRVGVGDSGSTRLFHGLRAWPVPDPPLGAAGPAFGSTPGLGFPHCGCERHGARPGGRFGAGGRVSPRGEKVHAHSLSNSGLQRANGAATGRR
jgi:hypothetical protein